MPYKNPKQQAAIAISMKKAGKTPKEISEHMKKGGVATKKKKMMGGGYTKKAEMAYGGMSKGKKHMYAAGGSVTDNPGLKALKKASPEAYNKITKG